MNKKKIVAFLLALGLVIPTPIEARAMSISRPSVRVSTPRVRSSIPRVSTPKTTSKPSTLKSGTSKMKVSNTSKSIKSKSNTVNKNKTTTKVDSGKFTVKAKTNSNKSTTSNKVITPIYYRNYSTTPYTYNRGLSIWDYYMISHLFNNNNGNLSDRDIAKALEEQGYSESEINKIIKDIKNENNKHNKKSTLGRVVIWTVGLTVVAIIIAIFIKGMR